MCVCLLWTLLRLRQTTNPKQKWKHAKKKMSSYIAAFKQTVNHYIHICTYSIRDESSRHGIHTIFTYLLVLSVFDYHYNIVGLPINDLVTNILLHGSNKRVNEITDCNNRGKRPNTRTFILISNAMLQNLMYKQIS